MRRKQISNLVLKEAALLGAIGAALVVYQHKLISTRDREACFKAFLNNNWVGCVIFIGLAADLQLGAAVR